jgi:hypothetical protein
MISIKLHLTIKEYKMFTLMAEYRGRILKIKSNIRSEEEGQSILTEYQIQYPDYDFYLRGRR